MKAYRKPSGVYIELGDTIPVSSTLVQVAPRPSALEVYIQASADPANFDVIGSLRWPV